ncbi:MAG TPA: UDP-N-acetylmuramoyl-tripeptide--D-alanyl-D-alanine ligase [Syntrophobacteraceae bacterium]|nr:UDP-N-acetylmuramoyl-tripeptide--D-alanyl-D-alanine ligase [Syntrophobacteraceae bacterium]
MSWTVARILEASEGQLLQGNPAQPVADISTDSRRIQSGDAFVPLIGDRFDGHDFLDVVVNRGVSVVLVQRDRMAWAAPSHVTVVLVEDTLRALGRLARYWRLRHPIPVVGITGSNGKTSTKEMLTSILQQNLNVLKNPGNLNNLVGAPLTLLQLQPIHDAAVVEMGINMPGEMARLVEIVHPDVGLITNIQPAHLEGLISPDTILAEKGLLWQGLAAGGLAVVNRDDERLKAFAQNLSCRQLSYSLSDPVAEVHVRGEVFLHDHGSDFQLDLEGNLVEVTLPVLGRHQVHNAVAAAAVAYGIGQPVDTIVEGLAQHHPVSQRMQIRHLADGTRIIDDTYNANPRSVLAAVQTLAAVHDDRPWMVVLGEMRELGETSAALHRKLGQRIGPLGMDRLFTLGGLAEHIATGAKETGLAPDRCYHGADHDDIVVRLKSHWVPGAWILVKGSRGMTMEKIVEGIMAP